MDIRGRTFFIINPKAAQGRSGERWQKLCDSLKSQGLDFDVEMTTAPESAIHQVRDALDKGYRRIVAVGGDGLANEALNGFIDPETDRPYYADAEFVVCPSGTGRDFARNIYENADSFADLADNLNNGRVRLIDIGRVDFFDAKGNEMHRYYLNSADAGLGANTCYEVEKGFAKRLWGKISFAFAAITAIFEFQYQPVHLEIDGEVRDGEFLTVFASNGRFGGGSMLITPRASLNDGLLDILIVDKMKKLRIFRFFLSVYKGKHIELPEVEYIQAKEIKISGSKLWFETDGELPGLTPAVFRVIPGVLRLRVPAELPSNAALDK